MAKRRAITIDILCRMFDYKLKELPHKLTQGFSRIETSYHEANKDEYEEYTLYVLKRMFAPDATRNRSENLRKFEKGWQENLELLQSKGISMKNLKPEYFRPIKFLRYQNKIIVSENLNLEYDLFMVARYLIFNNYLYHYDNIYELGCGSCQNLFLLAELFPLKNLYGLDWTKASAKIAKMLAKNLKRNISGFAFDMFNPSKKRILRPNSAVITIHSLEQMGVNYEKLLSFLLKARPGIVINYEPILEFYNEGNLLDYLALVYSKKRGYLTGFLSTLRKMEGEGKIKIIKAYRPYLGGVIHEASLIIWKPIY